MGVDREERCIVYVINSLGAGGAEQSLAELVPGFKQSGLRLEVVCLRRPSEGVEAVVREQGVSVEFLQGRSLLAMAWQLRRLLKRRRPALVHTTLFEADLLGRAAAAGTGIPVLTSLVNTAYAPVRFDDPSITPWKLRVVQAVDGWTARHLAGSFHAITEAVRDAAVEQLGIAPERITVVERGRDRTRLGEPGPERRAQVRARLDIGEQVPVLLSVGREEFQKGQRFLLECLPMVLSEFPAAVVCIAGRHGAASESLRDLADKLGVSASVRFLGFREDVPDLLCAADLFVFPSLYEGLGGAALEAMGLECPIVASDVPALREVLGDGRFGSLAPPGDASGLAQQILGLLRDPAQARTRAGHARKHFEDKYGVERYRRRMVELYLGLLSTSR